MDVMIPRNSVIPTKKVKMYTTVEDNQDTIEVEVSSQEPLTLVQKLNYGHVDPLVDSLMKVLIRNN